MKAKALLAVLVFVFALCIPHAGCLEVTEFPHYQTFDSWKDCFYIGTCYELYCSSLQGGWVNPEFHNPAPPFTEDVRSWWVISGPTTSNVDNMLNPLPCGLVQTGPCNDHTAGALGTGKYMYAEASACFGYKFRLNSPTIIFSNSNATFSFWYFMYGIDLDRAGQVTGYLQVKMSVDNGSNWVTLFDVQGRQQMNSTDPWLFFQTELDSFFPAPATPNSPVVANFQFEARTGGDRAVQTFWKSDIAIDDVLFTQAGASTVLNPYIDPITNGTGGSTEGGDGEGITDGEIAGIVVGVVGGLGALCCCLLLLLLLLLLIISPRGPVQKKIAPTPTDTDGNDGL